jgi:hypothetical protein
VAGDAQPAAPSPAKPSPEASAPLSDPPLSEAPLLPPEPDPELEPPLPPDEVPLPPEESPPLPEAPPSWELPPLPVHAANAPIAHAASVAQTIVRDVAIQAVPEKGG